MRPIERLLKKMDPETNQLFQGPDEDQGMKETLVMRGDKPFIEYRAESKALQEYRKKYPQDFGRMAVPEYELIRIKTANSSN